jgi:hypothetical protein
MFSFLANDELANEYLELSVPADKILFTDSFAITI